MAIIDCLLEGGIVVEAYELVKKTDRIMHKNSDIMSQLNVVFDEMLATGSIAINTERIQRICNDFCTLIGYLDDDGIAAEMIRCGIGIDIEKGVMALDEIVNGVETKDNRAVCDAEMALYKCLDSFTEPLKTLYHHYNAEVIVSESILFDADWYTKEYGDNFDILEMTPAHHYTYYGWKNGYNPSTFFWTSEYISDNPHTSNICPLYHYEEFGIFLKAKVNIHNKEELVRRHPECCSDIDDGFLRLRITNKCNGRCRYCGQLGWPIEKQQEEAPSEYYFEYLNPLYEKLKSILITGGEPLFAKESIHYLQYMTERYPMVNLKIESNAIGFSEQVRKICSDGLIRAHFSLNASNEEVFNMSCWAGKNGEVAYRTMIGNIRQYVTLLEKENKLCFAPDYSMVINKDNYFDVYDFVKLSLELKAYAITFYFDYTENDMAASRFSHDESREALRVMLEIERVLAKKVFVNFRLWVPSEELAPMQKIVDAMPYEELVDKYGDLLELAKDRNVQKENEERNRLRREHGKKEMTFEDDYSSTLHLKDIGGQKVCSSPWEMLDLYPNGRLDFCGWYWETLNVEDYIADGRLNIVDVVNSPQYMILRNHFLHGNYRGCQECCPMNDVLSPVLDIHAAGVNRKDK